MFQMQDRKKQSPSVVCRVHRKILRARRWASWLTLKTTLIVSRPEVLHDAPVQLWANTLKVWTWWRWESRDLKFLWRNRDFGACSQTMDIEEGNNLMQELIWKHKDWCFDLDFNMSRRMRIVCVTHFANWMRFRNKCCMGYKIGIKSKVLWGEAIGIVVLQLLFELGSIWGGPWVGGENLREQIHQQTTFDRGTFWRAILWLVLVSVINLLTPLERGDGPYLEVRAGDGARKGALWWKSLGMIDLSLLLERWRASLKVGGGDGAGKGALWLQGLGMVDLSLSLGRWGACLKVGDGDGARKGVHWLKGLSMIDLLLPLERWGACLKGDACMGESWHGWSCMGTGWQNPMPVMYLL